MADIALDSQSSSLSRCWQRTPSYDGVVYEHPRAPASALDRKVPLRPRWGALREDDDDATKQNQQTPARHDPQGDLVLSAGFGDLR